jgi:NADP-dependent 3-hydroxy acid dehydrogenase YdfG
VVVVTGASAGVGRAIAVAFADQGAAVGLLARGVPGLEAVRDDVEARGARALALPTDVSDGHAVEQAATLVEDRLGPIDVWVNAAMTSVFAPVHQLEADEVRRVAEVTYLGSVNGILAALRRMRPRDQGAIVQVGSALAYRGIPLQASYCGAKHAIRGFVDSLRCELAHENSRVRVTTVHLPGLNTPQFSWVRSRLERHPRPVPPVYQPEVAARAVVWAADHRRREVLVGGSTVATIMANKLAPGLVDRYLARTNVDAQQMDEVVPPDRPDNLFEPVHDHHDAHGIFDSEAHHRSVQLELTLRRPVAGAAAGGVAGAAAASLAVLAWQVGRGRVRR